MSDHPSAFDDFWEASSLDQFNIADFSRTMNAYDSDVKDLQLEFPGVAEPLPGSPAARASRRSPRAALRAVVGRHRQSPLTRISARRESTRAFSGRSLTRSDISEVLGSLYAHGGLEHRGYPSAGASYVTEAFCVGFDAQGLAGRIAYYDAETHGLVTVSEDAPSWTEARDLLNVGIEGTPGMLVVLVAFPERAVAKYGDRGGRFALLEVGAAMQQLSLAVAERRALKGVIVGGMMDRAWLRLLGLAGTDARVVVGYLVGR